MREIGAFEANDALATLLDQVARGQEVVITRHGKPVARLVPETATVDREKAHQAVADIIAMRKHITLGHGLTIKDLIAEGRR